MRVALRYVNLGPGGGVDKLRRKTPCVIYATPHMEGCG
jgi:hypothetical protein